MVCAGITYDNVLHRIKVIYTAADGTKGESFSNPYTFEDIYDTDVANGWGLVEKYSGMYIIQEVGIYLYSPSYFRDMDLFIKHENNLEPYIWRNNSANVQLYRVVWDTDKNYTPRWMGTFSDVVDEYADCVIKGVYYSGGNHSVFTRCSFYNINYVYLYENTLFYDCAIFNPYTLWIWGSGEVENTSIINSTSGGVWIDAHSWNGEATVRNVKLLDCGYDILYRLSRYNPKLTLIDCEVDLSNESKTRSAGYAGSAEATVKTTFKTNIINSNGGKLEIFDQFGNLVYEEILTSDEMTDTEITYDNQYYENSETEITVDERTTYEPFTLKVTKPGYQDLEISGITVTPGVPTKILGEMVEPIYVDRAITGAVEAAAITGTIETAEITGAV